MRRELLVSLATLACLVWAPNAHAQTGDTIPPGHPPIEEKEPHGRAAAAGGALPGMFVPPKDEEREDPTLQPGTIAVDLRDADGGPVAHEQITLGVLVNSVAKGESRKRLQAETDSQGRAVFSGLETASNIAYRVSVGYQGGLFAATPFQLQQAKAMRVTLHVYPVTRDIQQARVVGQVAVAAEVREDRIQIEEMLTIYNLGRTAWQPSDVTMALPEGATAFSGQTSMTDQGVDESGGTAKLRGTFPPGEGAVEFRWQLPWSGEPNVDFSVGLPPHIAIARVMMAASADTKLAAAGFPAPEVQRDAQGQSFLVTERHLRPDEPKLTALSIGIHDLPSAGPGRTVAALLAACGVALGLLLGLGKAQRRLPDAKTARSAVLEELLSLEQARASGEVGPKTYERVRRQLIDTLARSLAGS
jgi:hypothetical protein